MNLPNFFLADLPSDAEVTPLVVAEACRSIRRNRERHLASRTTENIIRLIATVAESWIEDASPWRQLALEHGPAETGFSAMTLKTGLDAFFRELTATNLESLVAQDLGDVRRLDRFCPDASGDRHRLGIVTGPELLAHFAAGNLPNPALMSIVLGLLARSAQFVKCSRGGALLPRLFAHSIHAADSKIGACLEIAEWPGGTLALEEALFAEADCVTATGSDETLASLRQRLPARVKFIGHGHRVSFGFITRAALAGGGARNAVSHAADDVVAWNQVGCLSPHVFYVETGGLVNAQQFAGLLAEELAQREITEPRGAVPTPAAAAIASRRAFYEVRAANADHTQHWFSEGSTAWSVICEAEPLFQQSCLHRFVYVKPAASLTEALQAADNVRGRVSTVGLAALPGEAPALAEQLARWGATRVCPLGRMQQPPLTWRHDGRPALGELLTWTDWETG